MNILGLISQLISIKTLRLTVSYTKFRAILRERFTVELCPIIGDDSLRYSELGYNVLPDEFN